MNFMNQPLCVEKQKKQKLIKKQKNSKFPPKLTDQRSQIRSYDIKI